jgi:four helix bundle protein
LPSVGVTPHRGVLSRWRYALTSIGSNAEVEALATIAADLGYLDPATAATITDMTDHIGRMITNLIRHMS